MKLFKMMIVLAILAIAGVAEARLHYIIRFRNGKEIVTSNYKVSGHQIKYYRFGGWISVPKDRIAEIEDRDNGEKRVFNSYHNEQDTKALRKSQAGKLDKIMRKQEARDLAAQPDPPKDKKDKKGETIAKKKPRYATDAECSRTRNNPNLNYTYCLNFIPKREHSITLDR